MDEKTKKQANEPGYIETFFDGAGKGGSKGVREVKDFVNGGYKEKLGIAAIPAAAGVGGTAIGAAAVAGEAGVVAAIPVVGGILSSASIGAAGAAVAGVGVGAAVAATVAAEVAIVAVASEALAGGVDAVREKMRRSKEREAPLAESAPQSNTKPKA